MIPITFNKDDANNLKKGNIRGQDLASYLSISMPKVAGILDIFTNPVSITNNVVSSGYTTLTLNKGYINIYGRCIYVEQGEQVQVRLPTSGTTNGIFGIRVNLGQTGSSEVEWFTSTTNLQQDNLLNNEIDGIYEFGVYRYTATNNSFTLGEKIAPIIKNIQEEDFVTQPVDDNSNKIATTEFVTRAVNNAKNIISGDISIPVTTTNITDKYVKRQVNFVIGKLRYDPDINLNPYSHGFDWKKIGEIPEGFRPKQQINIVVNCLAEYISRGNTQRATMAHSANIETDGSIYINPLPQTGDYVQTTTSNVELFELQFGYEITQ